MVLRVGQRQGGRRRPPRVNPNRGDGRWRAFRFL